MACESAESAKCPKATVGLLQNVFPLFPCNWLAILFPKLYHGRKPVSSLPECLLCTPQYPAKVAVAHSARQCYPINGGSKLSMLLHRRHPMMLHAQRPAHSTAVGLALLAAG